MAWLVSPVTDARPLVAFQIAFSPFRRNPVGRTRDFPLAGLSDHRTPLQGPARRAGNLTACCPSNPQEDLRLLASVLVPLQAMLRKS